MTRIPVTILTGFLGAGKTTLLNRLLAEPAFGDTAVVVNEFGEAGVDGALIERSGDRAFAMSTGCLCCTVTGDVRATLMQLLDDADAGRAPRFRRMVIETTGLADPMPVLQTFMSSQEMLSRFALNGVATLVDAVHGADAIDRFEEARRQIAVADLLLVSKGDLARDPASQRDVAALRRRLSAMNPNAAVETAADVDAARLFSLAAFDPAGKPPDVRAWLRFADPDDARQGQAHKGQTHRHDHAHDHHGRHDHARDVNRHGDAASAFCFAARAALDPVALHDSVAALQSTFGTDLLRMKGVVALDGHPDGPAVLHVVGHIASPLRLLDGWPSGLDTGRLVMIVAGPTREEAPEMLSRFLPGLEPYAAPGSVG